MLIIPQMPGVEPTPTTTYNSDNRGTRNVYIRNMDLGRFGYTAGCPACEVPSAGLPMSGHVHTAECRKRLEQAITTDTSTATRVKATRVRQAERIIRDLDGAGMANPSSSSGSGPHNTCQIFGPRVRGFKFGTRSRNADLWNGGIRNAQENR